MFEFDRGLKDTVAYANAQKNGSLRERLKIDALELEIPLPSNDAPKEEIIDHQATNIEKSHNDSLRQIPFNITDDVDDEAIYGRKRLRNKTRGR